MFNDPNLFYTAQELLRKTHNITFFIKECVVEQWPNSTFDYGQFVASIKPPRIIKLKVEYPTAQTDFSWEADYIITSKDIEEKTIIDELAKIPQKIANEKKELLRLAFILLDGYGYVVNRTQSKEFLNKGWHPKVVNIKSILPF